MFVHYRIYTLFTFNYMLKWNFAVWNITKYTPQQYFSEIRVTLQPHLNLKKLSTLGFTLIEIATIYFFLFNYLSQIRKFHEENRNCHPQANLQLPASNICKDLEIRQWYKQLMQFSVSKFLIIIDFWKERVYNLDYKVYCIQF